MRLKKSRTYVHSFSRNTFQQVAAPGEEAVKRADALVNKASEEFKYRQIGLVVSIGFDRAFDARDLFETSPDGKITACLRTARTLSAIG